jgi:hypothetical protein
MNILALLWFERKGRRLAIGENHSVYADMRRDIEPKEMPARALGLGSGLRCDRQVHALAN